MGDFGLRKSQAFKKSFWGGAELTWAGEWEDQVPLRSSPNPVMDAVPLLAQGSRK